ncbi:hypothetical protein CRENBAI_000696 [Crenichthys baileyi]|uniref:DUF4174 domain-containing protein n=1 Tax=Crenichthys baileyi TaxID=28760 RepID=A0AAV9SH97_9TELE
MKKTVLTPQRARNVTVASQRQPLDKKAALMSKIQDILNGRSRFVIRKKPAGSAKGKASNSNDWETSKVSSGVQSVSKSDEKVEKNRPPSPTDEGKKTARGQNSKNKEKTNIKADTETKEKAKKKGKRNKGKKGKGKKTNREVSEEDETALGTFLESIRGSRRLMLISTPSRDAVLYIQQTEENKKQHCELAMRKITVVTTVGEGSDATISVQHQQLETERPLNPQSEQVFDFRLIPLLRAEFGLSSSDLFSMTVTDYDIKPKRVFEAPPSSQALFEYIDNFPSRNSEKERKRPPVCSKDKQAPVVENSLLRFMSKRRLLLISAPSEDDYSFQQQISALSGQECQLGRSQSEVEPLSRDEVNNLKEQLEISKDYFSMLVVGKDGDVKAWFPSPMWSLDNIYDLVDSMELRIQEANLQMSVGILCPEDVGRGGSEAGHYPGYDEDGAEGTNFYHQSED